MVRVRAMAIDPVDDLERMPGSDEIRALLRKYFGPVTDEQSQTIEKRLHETASSVSKLHKEMQMFYGNSVHSEGRAWKEELSYGRRAPRIVDLVPWFASTAAGFPPARPYCPDAIVGEWEDTEGNPHHWTFQVDGTFRTDDPDLAGETDWFLIRKDGSTHSGDEIRVYAIGPQNAKVLDIKTVAPTELVMNRFGGGPKPRKFRLRRIK